MDNMIWNPLRAMFSWIWRLLYMLPSQFDNILHQLFSLLNMKNVELTLNKLGLSNGAIMGLAITLLTFIIIFQVVWNVQIGVDNDQMGQSSNRTIVIKSIIAIIICVTSIRGFTYIDTQIANLVTQGYEKKQNIINANSLVAISSNKLLREQLESNSINGVKGCEDVNNRAEYQNYNEKTGEVKGTATRNDIYNCYEVNTEVHDIKDKSNFKDIVSKLQDKGIVNDSSHTFETSNITLLVIGICTTITLAMITLNLFKTRFEALWGILISPFFAGAFVTAKSSAWQQFLKMLVGKWLTLIVTLVLLRFSFTFLDVIITQINEMNVSIPLFLELMKTLVVVAFYGTIAGGCVYVNNYLGGSGMTGASGGKGVLAGAGIGATISSASQIARNTQSVTNSMKSGGNVVKSGVSNVTRGVGNIAKGSSSKSAMNNVKLNSSGGGSYNGSGTTGMKMRAMGSAIKNTSLSAYGNSMNNQKQNAVNNAGSNLDKGNYSVNLNQNVKPNPEGNKGVNNGKS